MYTLNVNCESFDRSRAFYTEDLFSERNILNEVVFRSVIDVIGRRTYVFNLLVVKCI